MAVILPPTWKRDQADPTEPELESTMLAPSNAVTVTVLVPSPVEMRIDTDSCGVANNTINRLFVNSKSIAGRNALDPE